MFKRFTSIVGCGLGLMAHLRKWSSLQQVSIYTPGALNAAERPRALNHPSDEPDGLVLRYCTHILIFIIHPDTEQGQNQDLQARRSATSLQSLPAVFQRTGLCQLSAPAGRGLRRRRRRQLHPGHVHRAHPGLSGRGLHRADAADPVQPVHVHRNCLVPSSYTRCLSPRESNFSLARLPPSSSSSVVVMRCHCPLSAVVLRPW